MTEEEPGSSSADKGIQLTWALTIRMMRVNDDILIPPSKININDWCSSGVWMEECRKLTKRFKRTGTMKSWIGVGWETEQWRAWNDK